MIKIAMVEDDISFQEDIKKQLGQMSQEIEIVTFSNAEDFLNCDDSLFDIVLMDIQLPKMNGLDAARVVRKKNQNILIIFITNLAQFAIKGYEVQAYDFILKPINAYDFQLKMKEAIKTLNFKKKKVILISNRQYQKPIDISLIYYIEVRNHQLTFHTTVGVFEQTSSLKKLISELGEDAPFYLCNSCFLVNLKYISSVSGYDLELTNGEKLSISHHKRKLFMHHLNCYFSKGGGF